MVAKRPRTSPASWLEGLLLIVAACHHEGGGDGGDTSGASSVETGSANGSGSGSGSESASEGGSEEAGDDSLPPPECDAPQIACGQECADLDSDPANCGACGIGCVGPMSDAACEAGMCTLGTCELGFADCDADVANGCEHAIDCEPGDACATTCGSTGLLGCGDPCTPTCAAPAESCNGLDDDCDGVCDQGPLDGCRKPIHRATGSLGHFYTDSVSEVTGNGFTMEAENFFFLYSDGEVDGVQPLFRCIKAGGRRFLTSSTDCETTGGPELTLGFMSPDADCGSIPLYRVYAPGSDDHFYTTSLAERDNAIAMYGYQDQGITGYVWTSL